MNWLKQNLSLVVWETITVAILGIALAKHPIGLVFTADLPSRIPGILGSLLVVSLFVERVIEVFVSIWRDEETDTLQQALENFQDTLSRRKQDIAELVKEAGDPKTTPTRQLEITSVLNDKRGALADAEKGIDTTKTSLVPKIAHIRRISTWVGMAVGVLTSAVGFRFLEQVVNIAAIKGFPEHYAWFIFTDVLLTGTVLAGGSKAIHSIYSVYESFVVSTTKRAEGSR
jgi:hypothetical protein